MTQNEVLAQCARDFIRSDETCEHFYGQAYESLQKSVAMDEQASKNRTQVHKELGAQMKQLGMQVEHLVSLEKERTFHMIEVSHYINKVKKLTQKSAASNAEARDALAATENAAAQDGAQEAAKVPMSQMSPVDRNIIKMKKAIQAQEEFHQRSDLIMMCIERFFDKIKIDLTVRFVKFIELDHAGIMDGIFNQVDNFFTDQLSDAAQSEFEWRRDWNYYYQEQERLAKIAAQEELEQQMSAQAAAELVICDQFVKEDPEPKPPEGYYNYLFDQAHGQLHESYQQVR